MHTYHQQLGGKCSMTQCELEMGTSYQAEGNDDEK
jgi:hypothetical protein